LLPCHSTGLAGQWVGLAGHGFFGFIMRVHGGAALAGRWRVGFNKERKNYLPLLHVRGKEKGEQCRSKRHCSAHFFLHETTPFYEKRAVSFKGGASILFSN